MEKSVGFFTMKIMLIVIQKETFITLILRIYICAFIDP